ncbi:MAG: LuxR family transcriptional regulator [Caldilinea sp. CFX5]|nr:LuxR family transcriptional regulator [Caldilinea sp. CFX5]
MIDAILDPRHRNPPTPSELAVIRALAHGKSRKELARYLAISYATLSRHLYNIQMKLGAQSAEQMVYMAVKQGLID